MKRLIAVILIVTYFTATAGASVCTHYCMGKLKAYSIWQIKATKKSCAICGMHKKKGCCEDRQLKLQVEKQYSLPQTGFTFLRLVPSLRPVVYNTSIAVIPLHNSFTHSNGAAPPGLIFLPLYIKNCVYRI